MVYAHVSTIREEYNFCNFYICSRFHRFQLDCVFCIVYTYIHYTYNLFDKSVSGIDFQIDRICRNNCLTFQIFSQSLNFMNTQTFSLGFASGDSQSSTSIPCSNLMSISWFHTVQNDSDCLGHCPPLLIMKATGQIVSNEAAHF